LKTLARDVIYIHLALILWCHYPSVCHETFISRSWYSVLIDIDATISYHIKKTDGRTDRRHACAI